MREIKFRAWKKTNDPEMFNNVTSIDFKKGVVGLGYKVSSWQIREDSEPLENLMLMQYTGLKDKNGVEIYEDDIVNVYFYQDAYIGHYGDFYDPISSVHTEVVKTEEFCIHPLYADYDSIEVIGNKYENPELLKQ